MVRTGTGFSPWNDYDLLLVTPTRRGWEGIGSLCAELKGGLSLPGLDIVPFRPRDLARAAATMLVHDARECHVVLRGNPEPLHAIPLVPVAVPEALILLLNRMVCLLECPPGDLTGVPPDPVRFPSQVSKAVLAVVDAALVRASAYVVRYRDKVTRFSTMTTDQPLLAAAEDGLSFRMEPGPRAWGSDAWHLACNRLTDCVGQLVGCSAGHPERMADALWRRRFSPLRQTLHSLLQGHLPDVRRRAVECAELMVLAASAVEDPNRTRMLGLARGFLERFESLPPHADWAGMAEHAVRRWFAVCYG